MNKNFLAYERIIHILNMKYKAFLMWIFRRMEGEWRKNRKTMIFLTRKTVSPLFFGRKI
jgi:hypothetical protein